MKTSRTLAGRWGAWALAAAMSLPAAPVLAQHKAPLPGSARPGSEVSPGNEASAQPSPQDLAVAERVRDTLMSDMAMEGIQLLVSVWNGTVELLGVARDRAQAERAVQLTREIPGVDDVVHYIEVEGARPAGNLV